MNLKAYEKRLADLERASLGPGVDFEEFLTWWRALPAHDLGVYWEAYAAGIGQFLPIGADVAGHVATVRRRREDAIQTIIEFTEERQ